MPGSQVVPAQSPPEHPFEAAPVGWVSSPPTPHRPSGKSEIGGGARPASGSPMRFAPSFSGADFAGQPGNVEVIIRNQHDGFFGRPFNRSVATVTASAVASNMEGTSNSASLVALDPETCKSGGISGNNTSVTIEPVVPGAIGGYVHINSDCGSDVFNTSCESVGDGALRLDGNGSSLTAPQRTRSGERKSTRPAASDPGLRRIQREGC